MLMIRSMHTYSFCCVAPKPVLYAGEMSDLPRTWILGLCLMVAACGSMPKRQAVWNPYDLNPAAGNKPIPADNDSYYTPPSGFIACATINDAPSCSGSD
jgi:hypothetical protein